MDVDAAIPLDRYGEVLADYLKSPGEQALYEASLLSRDLVHQGVGPEEIIALHVEALEQSLESYTPREQARCVGHAHQFLLEVMISYGLTYREYLEMKVRERDSAAARAVEERTELLATVAHEMRTGEQGALLAERGLRGDRDGGSHGARAGGSSRQIEHLREHLPALRVHPDGHARRLRRGGTGQRFEGGDRDDPS